jgi:SAM-dependent methyltransferase
MYSLLIDTLKKFPIAYETTGIAFWDDEHVSKSMLKAHLVTDEDGASRNHSLIKKSVDWLECLSAPGSRLLDLGCGPGIYAEMLYDKGYRVTGIDFSKRSIEYAIKSALRIGKSIEYLYMDYLAMDYLNEFHMAILIYCDFGVLSPNTRKILLNKVYTALKPGGLFVVDVFTPRHYDGFSDNMTVTFDEAGFWRSAPYVCIKRDKRYDNHVFLEQYTVLTEQQQQTYNLWNHAFSPHELEKDLRAAGFTRIEFYGDVTGLPLEQNSPTICAVCKKS